METMALSVAGAEQKTRPSPTEEIKNRREHERAEHRAEKQRTKKEGMERRALAANFITQAREIALMLVDDPKFDETPLAEKTEDEIDQTLRNFDITYKRLRKEIWEARDSHGDNVTLFPPKPWAKS